MIFITLSWIVRDLYFVLRTAVRPTHSYVKSCLQIRDDSFFILCIPFVNFLGQRSCVYMYLCLRRSRDCMRKKLYTSKKYYFFCRKCHVVIVCLLR